MMNKFLSIVFIVFVVAIAFSFSFVDLKIPVFTWKDIALMALFYVAIWVASMLLVSIFTEESNPKNTITIPLTMFFIMLSFPFFKTGGYFIITGILCSINALISPYIIIKRED